MKKIYIILTLITSFLVLTACDDFLDNKPSGELPDDQAFETIDDCEAGLNGAYRSMYNFVVSYPISYDMITDDIKQPRWGGNNYGGIRNFDWSSGSFGDASSPWGSFYSQISRVNNLLKGIEKFGETPTTKRIKGEAIMLRAIAHFELLRLYGYKYNKTTADSDKGIPYVYESNMSVKERLSVAKTLSLVLEDLEDAERYMKDVETESRPSNSAIFYLSLDALYAFETRIYLYMQEYDKVITSTNKLAGYQLINADQANFNSMWRNDAPFNEVIYMVGVSSTEAAESFSISQAIYICDKYNDDRAKPLFLPGSELMALYDKTSDVRWQAYFTENYPMAPSTTDNNEPLTIVTKYPGNSNISTSDRINHTKYFRYAEVLLNKIEALYHTDEPQALIELNDFRKKRIIGYTDQTYTGQTLLDEIKLERRKEFAFEGMRFHDLRRWNDGFIRDLDKYTAISDKINVSGTNYHWIFPIPQYEMNANSLPSDYQNPGY